MTTIIARQLNALLERQERTEKQLALLKKAVLTDDERFIYPKILKKWEQISRGLDRKKDRSFSSVSDAKKWLKNIWIDNDDPKIEKIVFSSVFERIVKKCKKSNLELFDELAHQIEKIISEPTVGKPLRYTLKNRRRVHVGSFVLIYEFHQNELRFLDFDHHDRIYKKY
mgnify:FL=1